MDLIGLIGLAGSGKDTVGQYFESNHGFTTISFADSLKDCLSVMFGWDRLMLEGRTPKSRAWREEIDVWWAEKLGIPHFTPRFAMTNFGTDVMRNYFHDQIWVLCTERKINQTDGPVVITDVRFPNELKMVQRLGGTVYKIKRGPDPIWGETALDAIAGNVQAKARLTNVYRVHESEWLLYGEDADAVIRNDDDIAALYDQCSALIPSRTS